jgi:hypothetical protein
MIIRIIPKSTDVSKSPEKAKAVRDNDEDNNNPTDR